MSDQVIASKEAKTTIYMTEEEEILLNELFIKRLKERRKTDKSALLCEEELRKQGITLLQTEASPNAYLFYEKLGYIEMPFNNPDGEPTHPDDRAMGKYL